MQCALTVASCVAREVVELLSRRRQPAVLTAGGRDGHVRHGGDPELGSWAPNFQATRLVDSMPPRGSHRYEGSSTLRWAHKPPAKSQETALRTAMDEDL